MTGTVLILGVSGKIGAHAARAFGAAGWTVRTYKRGTDMNAAAMGADVIVNGLNPPAYHNWAKIIPEITAQVIAAAQISGATVILPASVYNFGDVGGEWSETTLHRPVARKGRIREESEAAYEASGLNVIVLRAGNFIDPDRNGDIMSLLLLRDVAKGKVTHAGGADVMQAYCYMPDWAAAAVALAEKRGELARHEEVTFPGHAFTITQLRDTLSDALGCPLKVAVFPWWLMFLISPFVEFAHEIREMRYLYETPHTLSGTKFNRLLPDFRPTDMRTVMLAGLPPEIYPNQPMRSGQLAVSA